MIEKRINWYSWGNEAIEEKDGESVWKKKDRRKSENFGCRIV